ncbi:MAG TPA: histidine--tRNA ligase [bacterium]|nr:histidine--tRNA ligase [bacterium]HPL95246.1 histidine--tRNA ligase [bacterium]
MPRSKKSIETKEKARGRWQTPKGFKDILPENHRFWHFLIERLEETAEDYSYQHFMTPFLESISYWEKALNLSKEKLQTRFFVFHDHDNQSLVLRPDLIIPMIRGYFEHNMLAWPSPVKLWQCGQIFQREENINHFRQSTQFVFEILNSASSEIDAQIIMMGASILKNLGLMSELEINSVGCHKCRREYSRLLIKFLKEQKICLSCRRNNEENPFTVFACADKKCQEAISSAPQIVDSLCDECRAHFVKVLEILDENGVIYNLSPLLIPANLNYYERTVFDFYFSGPGDKKQNLLASGGRIDQLTQTIGGRGLPSVVFSGYAEKIILKLKDQGVVVKEETHGDVFLAQLGDEAKKKCLKLFNELRKEGVKVKEAFAKKGLTEQLEIANKLKVKYALILGQKEILDNTIIIRDMESGVQEIVDFEKITSEIKKRLLGQSDVKVYDVKVYNENNNHQS